ncbi:SRPBCC family protein [Mycobacterium sp. 1423905.2]|uniref:SRPBCC family protein n=1 Tax=Mycobacterium sp. 1423905.2 TaxID=1856859 RepID=UPI0007FF145B|nr:hypothetical protein [Mycobacterium sp. 1423905.2]OBJ53119.1 hypothetical protein A9W95_18935 [Mycobacterium sp. 1423905.2]
MTQTVTVSRVIRCPVDEASGFVTDPHKLIPEVSAFSRCKFVESCDDGELWDVFLNSGTIYLGGRVLVSPPGDGRMTWRSVRGTRHSFEARVEPHRRGSRLTLTLQYRLTGYVIARISELIGRGLATRNLEAAAEEIRHHLEFESDRSNRR